MIDTSMTYNFTALIVSSFMLKKRETALANRLSQFVFSCLVLNLETRLKAVSCSHTSPMCLCVKTHPEHRDSSSKRYSI